ncbi:hypothetical protein H1O16_gp305 [Burkholderia phage BcepSaruman]|uniref:Uncharacterized protein n=1 Tax=Burkholderia phage BcepSaruman TaxID=2530032 RepID=A0A4D5ZI26_9CAUD|nr:hypothetical protein H1O16_gp305 [Burkholderia phage BcepSaruman]QBX06718.1 hypothetical protein BcepSaruman_305 [Burkholderia phage BcepSaruman]
MIWTVIHAILSGIGWYFWALFGIFVIALGGISGFFSGMLFACFDAKDGREAPMIVFGTLLGVATSLIIYCNYAPHP